MSRYLVKVAYSGENYSGFQRQPGKKTIQGELEKTLSFLLGVETTIHASGRTDAGVHAVGQRFCFDAKIVDPEELILAANRLLPEDIFLKEINRVADTFDARRNCLGKTYQYRFTVNQRDPLLTGKVMQLRRDDFRFEPFLQALSLFSGEHNFQNFTTKPEDKWGFVRTVKILDVMRWENGNLINVIFGGNGFMRYQIRMMMGAAIKVGLGRLDMQVIRDALEAKERSILPYKASAAGLCLLEVFYEKPAFL